MIIKIDIERKKRRRGKRRGRTRIRKRAGDTLS